MKYLLYLLLFSGCGMTVSGHLDPIQVDPITVNHMFDIDFQQAFLYCQNQCDIQSSDPVTQNACTQQCYNQFLSVFGAAAGLAIPTPTPNP